MGLARVIIFCCALNFIGQVTMASEKMEEEGKMAHREARNKDESPATRYPENALPDSHEAMNNRESPVEIRAKRSYEFLVGLINNNSRYEVTRVDPALTTQKPKIVSDDVTASEILLELMVRIAAHPDQWSRVHKLLKSIDDDLATSNNVIKKLREGQSQATSESSKTNHETPQYGVIAERKNNAAHLSQRNASVVGGNTRKPDKTDKKMSVESTWPTFSDESRKVLNKSSTKDDTKLGASHKPSKATFPKNFAYHRVTGTPIDLNKSPKAYIAVSVIAPKPSNARSKEEALTLENELHQLKPWTHQTNLQKMASIRSRWVIGDSHEDGKGS